jgi:hypothetical protein
MDQIKRFSEKFTPRHGFARSIAIYNIPSSQYLLDQVELSIRRMEDLWGIAFNEAENGTSVSAENCWYCRQKFDIPVGQFWYQVAMSQCELEKLSKTNNNTTFSDCDENYKIINQLKDARINLLFQISGFEEALFKMISATIAYDNLPLSEKNDYHPLSLEIFEATQTIKKIANNVDQKLFEFTKDPTVFENYSLYLPLLSMLGIQLTVIKEPKSDQNKDLVHEQIAKLQSQIAILQQQLAELQLLV